MKEDTNTKKFEDRITHMIFNVCESTQQELEFIEGNKVSIQDCIERYSERMTGDKSIKTIDFFENDLHIGRWEYNHNPLSFKRSNVTLFKD